MIETDKGIPNFDDNGYLPHKCYEVTLEDIKEKLVDNFPNSKTRKSRFECFLKFYNELIKNVKSCTTFLIDGSFVTNKVNPRDVDFTVTIDTSKLTNNELQYLNKKLHEKTEIRKEFKYYEKYVTQGMIKEESLYNLKFYKMGCDFFYIEKYPMNHQLFKKYLENKEEWIEFWGHDRNENKKGFLKLIVDYEGDLNERL